MAHVILDNSKYLTNVHISEAITITKDPTFCDWEIRS